MNRILTAAMIRIAIGAAIITGVAAGGILSTATAPPPPAAHLYTVHYEPAQP